MATAKASAASAVAISHPGSKRPTIMATCSLLAWPVPTTACLTIIGRYSATGMGLSAGVNSAMPRAMPSLSVEDGFWLDRLVSTAASSGVYSASTAEMPSCNWTKRSATGRAESEATTPLAMWRNRLPSASITPQPVRRRPGSSPMTRMLPRCSRFLAAGQAVSRVMIASAIS